MSTPADPRQATSRRASALRIALVVAWLALYGHHASGHLLPSLGFIDAGNIQQLIETHVDYRYRYDVLDQQGDEIGSVHLGYTRMDTDYEISMDLDFERLSFIPGSENLLAQLPGENKGVLMNLTTTLNHEYLLSGIHLEGSVADIAGEFTSSIDHRGLNGTLSIPSMNVSRPINLPDFTQTQAAGMSLASGFPPNLKPGDRFSTEVMGLKATPPFVDRKRINYEVRDQQITGEETLSELVIVDEGVERGAITVDERGVVHYALTPDGLTMRLRNIWYRGAKTWPPEEVVDTGVDEEIIMEDAAGTAP